MTAGGTALTAIDRTRLEQLMERERERFAAEHPASRALHERASASLLDGVPMNWMTRWPGEHPVFVREARGGHLVCADGRDYVDLCFGDTGAMAGHAPEPSVAAIGSQAARGLTFMLPTEDAAWLGEEMQRRFGLPFWQFALSATDANRFVLRLAREITGRPRVLVHNHCYHGSVDETVVSLHDGAVVPRHGNVGPAVDPALTTRVVEINDTDALERELAQGDVACVLVEPALTNIGIVLPQDGYHAALRSLTREHESLLVIDETHTICAGPGGATAAWGLEPDFLTIGKAIAGGAPIGAYGFTAAVAERIGAHTLRDAADVGGVGGTLAGNALSLAAARATLDSVLTDEAFERMITLGERFEDGVRAGIEAAGMPWSVQRIGCRVEYMFAPEPPRNGGSAHAAFDTELDAYMHLAMLNRGILLTPFHMMALMSPASTAADVDAHTEAFAQITLELAGRP